MNKNVLYNLNFGFNVLYYYSNCLLRSVGGKFYFVELEADLETRLERNITPHRLEAKPTKRDIEWSKKD